jgi:hypothetical protein
MRNIKKQETYTRNKLLPLKLESTYDSFIFPSRIPSKYEKFLTFEKIIALVCMEYFSSEWIYLEI